MTIEGTVQPVCGRPHEGRDDFALMEGIAAGDRAALSAFYDRYSPHVLAVCLRILRNRSEAEEVMVDVFWEVWDRAERYNPSRGAPRTYLMTLTRSRAIDRRRSRGFAAVSLDTSAMGPASEAPGGGAGGGSATALERAVAQEERDLVKRAVEQLDSTHRQVVEMSFFDGLSHSEIAEALHSPLGTVKTRVRQGLIRLRRALGEGFAERDVK